MNIKTRIDSIKGKFVAFMTMLGTATPIKSTLIFPFGLYGKPTKGAMALTTQDKSLVFALQDHRKVTVALQDGDVCIADGKSTIHLSSDGSVTITSSDIKLVGNVDITGSVTNNGINIGATHKHGGVMVGAGFTLPPIP